MKIGFCYSGHIGRVVSAAQISKKTFLPVDGDVFIYTSDAVTQKHYPKKAKPFYNVDASKVREYLPGKVGWRTHSNSYGIIYPLDKKLVYRELNKAFPGNIKAYKIEHEDITVKDGMNGTKWDWLRNNQWRRMYKSHMLLERYAQENNIVYDIVVRSRLDCTIVKKINIKGIFKKHQGGEKKIFAIGGWKNGKFMDEHLVDCFMFGNPEVMRTLVEIYNVVKPYPPDPKYKSFHTKHGDNSEYQVLKHLQEHKIQIVFFYKRVGLYKVLR